MTHSPQTNGLVLVSGSNDGFVKVNSPSHPYTLVHHILNSYGTLARRRRRILSRFRRAVCLVLKMMVMVRASPYEVHMTYITRRHHDLCTINLCLYPECQLRSFTPRRLSPGRYLVEKVSASTWRRVNTSEALLFTAISNRALILNRYLRGSTGAHWFWQLSAERKANIRSLEYYFMGRSKLLLVPRSKFLQALRCHLGST